MRKIIFAFFVLVSLVLLLIQYSHKLPIGSAAQQIPSGINIKTEPEGAVVTLNGQESGQTPFEKKDLTAGDYQVSLKKDNLSWEGQVTLIPGTLTVVNRVLSDDYLTATGETVTLEKGQGVLIVSDPEKAEVRIDGEYKGDTPLKLPDLPAGEHQYILQFNNYEPRSIRSNLPAGYQMNLFVNLSLVKPDPNATPEPEASTPASLGSQVTVKDTPNGFLRIRSGASTANPEVARVTTGKTLTLLEETSADWSKVKTVEGIEGYVSAQYIQK